MFLEIRLMFDFVSGIILTIFTIELLAWILPAQTLSATPNSGLYLFLFLFGVYLILSDFVLSSYLFKILSDSPDDELKDEKTVDDVTDAYVKGEIGEIELEKQLESTLENND